MALFTSEIATNKVYDKKIGGGLVLENIPTREHWGSEIRGMGGGVGLQTSFVPGTVLGTRGTSAPGGNLTRLREKDKQEAEEWQSRKY